MHLGAARAVVVAHGFGVVRLLAVVILLGVGGGAILGGAGCSRSVAPEADLGVAGSNDGAVYQECSSICLRPRDCAIAYPDGNICPPGFLCALRFMCRD